MKDALSYYEIYIPGKKRATPSPITVTKNHQNPTLCTAATVWAKATCMMWSSVMLALVIIKEKLNLR
jgi:hypothetical protein